MKTYKEIQGEIDIEFEEFFNSLISTKGIPRKYFYWSEEFFRIEGNLKFDYYPLNIELKNAINKLGFNYFESKEVYFFVNKNSNRDDLTVKNFSDLFSENNKKNQTQRYEYIKEFIFWKLLLLLLSNLKKQLEKNYKDAALKKEDELNSIIIQLDANISQLEIIIPIQRKNFLFTYVQFVTKRSMSIKNKDYSTFQSSIPKQYKKIIKNIEHIKKEEDNDNQYLKEKIQKLYIHKDFKSKLHFIFSKNGGAEKEELRELLDTMGNKGVDEYFRGQADASWILDASIKREEKFLKFESEMYYDILSLKPGAFQKDNSVYERLITMQHYELPTRLLDITRNPLIAIFFACNNWDRNENDGIVYAFSPTSKMPFLNFEDKKLETLESIYKKEKSNNDFLKNVSYLKGIAKNQRINNQSGDFIFVGDGENIMSDLNDLPHMHIVIDSKTKKALLEQLETLNIHAGSVYPDLSSMSKYISNKYKYLSELKKDTKNIDEIIEETQKEEIIVLPNFNDFWTKEKKNSFKKLINDYTLKKTETEDIIEYYLNNKDFPDYKVLNMLQEQPALMEREKIREALKSLIVDFIIQ